MVDREKKSISVALDAMGGDFAPEAIIEGANLILSGQVPCGGDVHFSIYGQEDAVLPLLSKYEMVGKRSVFINVPDVVLADDSPSYALRRRRKSSMWCAVNAVKGGLASGVVSSGNTGALMVMSRYLLGVLPGISRPAIAKVLPSRGEGFVALDLGANVECSADVLFQFAILGKAFARAVLGRECPKVGLLNIGVEAVKGTYAVKEAFTLLKNAGPELDFYGFIEAEGLFEGEVDVAVTDGFSGNIMLKTAESVAKLINCSLKRSINHSPFTKIAGCMLKSGLKKEMGRFYAKSYNGAILLGLNGVVVKSHGCADGQAVAYAISSIVSAIIGNINAGIAAELSGAE